MWAACGMDTSTSPSWPGGLAVTLHRPRVPHKVLGVPEASDVEGRGAVAVQAGRSPEDVVEVVVAAIIEYAAYKLAHLRVGADVDKGSAPPRPVTSTWRQAPHGEVGAWVGV